MGFGVDVLEGVSQVDGFFKRGVALLSELSVFILQVGDQKVEFRRVHFIFRFLCGSLTLAAALTPLRWFFTASCCSFMYAGERPNGEPSRMLNAFGSGQIVSSMFTSAP
jgi:hypothetical protein